jgi:predicted ArsR family transcriptional regulator
VETRPSGPAAAPIDPVRHRALGSARRVEILRLVRAEPGLTAAVVAARTGLHLNTVREHLDRLVGAGVLVKARASAGMRGRPSWRYRAVEDDPTPATAPYRALAAALLDDLGGPAGGGRAAAARIGERWGRALAAVIAPGEPGRAVLAVLTDLGFDPQLREGGAVHLRSCPYLDLVGRHPAAVCELHAGVVRGVLGAVGGAVVVEPFGAPDACVIRLDGRA